MRGLGRRFRYREWESEAWCLRAAQFVDQGGKVAQVVTNQVKDLAAGGKAITLGEFTTFLMVAIMAQQSVIENQDRIMADMQRRMLQTGPTHSWMVGDYLFDIQSCQAAGTKTVLMIGDRARPELADRADYVIRRLPDLLPIVNTIDGNESD